jgi:hypothetical protein
VPPSKPMSRVRSMALNSCHSIVTQLERFFHFAGQSERCARRAYIGPAIWSLDEASEETYEIAARR